MKIALQLSGLMRTYKDCHTPLFDNIIRDYDIDIFISTWDYELSDEDKKLMEAAYKPKGILYDEDLPKFINEFEISRLNNRYHQSYKWYQCNKLMRKYEKENNIKYDMVIRSRPDFKILKDFHFDPNDYDLNYLHFGSGKIMGNGHRIYGWKKQVNLNKSHFHRIRKFDPNGKDHDGDIIPLCDHISISSPEINDIYVGGFEVMNNWLYTRDNDDIIFGHGTKEFMPAILIYQIWNHQVPVKEIEGLEYELKR